MSAELQLTTFLVTVRKYTIVSCISNEPSQPPTSTSLFGRGCEGTPNAAAAEANPGLYLPHHEPRQDNASPEIARDQPQNHNHDHGSGKATAVIPTRGEKLKWSGTRSETQRIANTEPLPAGRRITQGRSL